MAGDDKVGCVEIGDIDGDPAEGLRGVDQQHGAVLTTECCDFGDMLDHTSLIIRQLHGDERGLLCACQQACKRFEFNYPGAIDWRNAISLQGARRMFEYCVVFHSADDQRRGAYAGHGELQRFAGAGREHDVLRCSANACSNLLACVFDLRAGAAAEAVHRRCIACLRHGARHRDRRFRTDRRAGVVVAIDRRLRHIVLFRRDALSAIEAAFQHIGERD